MSSEPPHAQHPLCRIMPTWDPSLRCKAGAGDDTADCSSQTPAPRQWVGVLRLHPQFDGALRGTSVQEPLCHAGCPRCGGPPGPCLARACVGQGDWDVVGWILLLSSQVHVSPAHPGHPHYEPAGVAPLPAGKARLGLSLGGFLPQQGWGKGSFPALINHFLEKVLGIAPLSFPDTSGYGVPTEPWGRPGFTHTDGPGDGTAGVSLAVPCTRWRWLP